MNIQEGTLVLLAAGAAVADLRSGRIPNSIIASGVGCGIARNCMTQGARGLLLSLAGAAIAALLPWLLFQFHMIGAGDVKLLAMAGAFTGPAAAVRITIGAFLTGGLLSAVLLIRRGTVRSRFQYLLKYAEEYLRTGIPRGYLEGVGPDGRFCFAVPIFAGICLELLRERYC